MNAVTENTASPATAHVYTSVSDMPVCTAGLVDGQYVWKGEDASRVFIFFTGAVAPAALPLSPVFQRWKWLHKFSNPVVIARDPLIQRTGNLQLAWYAGTQNGPTFDDIVAGPLRVARELSNGEICAFGSSGGGFAALMAAVRNHVDSSMAINPQTNVLRYVPQMRDKFLQLYTGGACELNQTDKERLSVCESLWRYHDKCRTHVIINIKDLLHYHSHVLPLHRMSKLMNYESMTFSCYDDAANGHNPPSQGHTLWLMQKWWPKCIAPSHRKRIAWDAFYHGS